MHLPEFADQPPAEVYATLLGRGIYLASIRTMYRVLAAEGETSERRNQRAPQYIIDLFSRYVVGWMLAAKECKHLAALLFAETIARHGIEPGLQAAAPR